MGLLSVRVVSKTIEAQDICSFELVSADGRALSAFTAGAHIDVHVGNGLIRQYSLCNAPSERHRYLIATLRDANSRGGSAAMHEQIHVGDLLEISEPRNHFELVSADRYLLLAGGIGITPILCMAEQLASADAEFELHYCTRAPERTAFRARMERAAFADKVHLHFDTGPDDQRLDLPRLLAQTVPGTHLYFCGPSGFIDHVKSEAEKASLLPSQIHLEHFSAPPVDASQDGSFNVRVRSTGETYAIDAGKTVIEVLAAHGIEVPVSCEAGVCGTCLTGVLEGTPDHRDVYLSDEEHAQNDQFTPCCSRAKSSLLVLDL